MARTPSRMRSPVSGTRVRRAALPRPWAPERRPDLFGRVAAAGIACWWGFQAFQNIGMCLGIMPVTGVPLPFVSYGGSSLFAGMLALGLLQNIHLRSAGPVRR